MHLKTIQSRIILINQQEMRAESKNYLEQMLETFQVVIVALSA
jgi:hypothetical protein